MLLIFSAWPYMWFLWGIFVNSLHVKEGICHSIHERSNDSYLVTLSSNQRALFEYAMNGLDMSFGPPFLACFDSPRYSAWYAVGLLARNEDDDVNVASKIIRDVIDFQYKDPSMLWFGTFKSQPDAPDPSTVYPPKLYGSYDSNQGLFVCTSWIIVMEEFQHLLESSLVTLMKESMYNATVGDGYRVGGVDGDNLYPVYSNPWYMRVMAATYVGHMQSDANLTFWGNEWASQAIAEFDRFGTLSEFNSGTYSGVTLYALSLWGYMPKNSTIASRAKDIITKTWISIGNYYNPTLKTLGGPWDRTYGFDMKSYFGILGAQITGLMGGIRNGTAPIPSPLLGSEHYGDVAAVALIPLISKFHDPYVPASVLSQLTKLDSGGHTYFAQAVSPPFENPSYPRNYTSWTGNGLSVGGIQIDGRDVGGAAINPTNFAPGVILWETGTGKTGWISHYATSSSISAVATSKNLTVSYPLSRAFPSNPRSNVITFLVSGFRGTTLNVDSFVNGTVSLPDLKLTMTGNVVERGTRSLLYGAETLNDLLYYNLTYSIPSDLEGIPEIILSFERV